MEKRWVREMKPDEAHFVVDYFHGGSADFLWNMGVDPEKLIPRKEWIQKISHDMGLPLEKRQLYYLLWMIGQQPVGHSNINYITFGVEANMHLHLWYPEKRQKGDGSTFIRLCLGKYFEKFKLQKVICEPNAKNPAPNKLLKSLGFTFIKDHDKNPGVINYHQTLSRWEMDRDVFLSN